MPRSIPFEASTSGARGERVARILIAGCGYVGTAVGMELVHEGHDVFGLRRKIAGLPLGIRPVEADLGLLASLAELPGDLEYVLYLASPGGSDDALYRAAYVEGTRNLLLALERQRQRPRRILFASSTAVYAQDDGSWVDEDSPTLPTHFSGRRLLEAEGLLVQSDFAVTVVRFGGIYGPRRTRLVEQVRTGRAVYPEDGPRYGNRIHRDDCAGVLRHLMGLTTAAAVYLGVDCEPVDQKTLLQWLAGALGAPPPRPAAAAALPEERRSSKRCRNDRLLASGYRFRYPTFREGYAAVLAGAA
jgi:nucleoside-diphosphate-sugar epimerase